MKLKMIGKLLMMTGLLILIGQTQAKASESVVMLQVPVTISGLLGMHVRSVDVVCRIWSTYPRHHSDGDVALQLSRGSFSGIAQVRLTVPHGEQFKVGDRYNCDLVLDHKRGTALAHEIQRVAKPGSRLRYVVTGRL